MNGFICMNDRESLIKAHYCRSILKVASISTDREARGLTEGVTTAQSTANTSGPMAEAERAALTAIRELAGHRRDSTLPKNSIPWTRAMQAIELWLNVHNP
jgi:hypothetical protein